MPKAPSGQSRYHISVPASKLAASYMVSASCFAPFGTRLSASVYCRRSKTKTRSFCPTKLWDGILRVATQIAIFIASHLPQGKGCEPWAFTHSVQRLCSDRKVERLCSVTGLHQPPVLWEHRIKPKFSLPLVISFAYYSSRNRLLQGGKSSIASVYGWQHSS